MLEIRGIWLCHMSRWDRYVLRPWIWMETSRSGTVSHIGPYNISPTRLLILTRVNIKKTKRHLHFHNVIWRIPCPNLLYSSESLSVSNFLFLRRHHHVHFQWSSQS